MMATARNKHQQTKPKPIPPLVHAIGGAIGSAFSLWLLYPLERARIELQRTTPKPRAGKNDGEEEEEEEVFEEAEEESWQDAMTETSGILRKDSVDSLVPTTTIPAKDHRSIWACIRCLHQEKVLYQGATTIVLTVGISNFVFFFINEFLKQLFSPRQNKKLPPLQKNRQLLRNNPTTRTIKLSPGRALLASSLAGICNVLITNPLWVANMNIISAQQTKNDFGRGLFSELNRIVREKGWRHLWSGTGASLLLVSNPILQFFVYEELKKTQLGAASSSHAFFTGALAKLIATVATYPLQLSQTLLRSNNDYKSTADCIAKLYQRNGVHALFRGMKAKMLQTVLTAAFTFLTYEKIVSALATAIVSIQQSKHNNK